MLDYNPFREYKEMMKKKRLVLENPMNNYRRDWGTTRQQDEPSPMGHPPRARISQERPEIIAAPHYEFWNTVNDRTASSEDLHKAIDFFQRFGGGGGEEIKSYNPNTGRKEISYSSGIPPESFYNALQAHPNATEEHHARVPSEHIIPPVVEPTPETPEQRAERLRQEEEDFHYRMDREDKAS